MIDKLFHYQAEVTKVIDGDTIDVRVDLGFCIYLQVRLRLARINAPELKGPERERGIVSRWWLAELLRKASHRVYVKTEQETDKYGRYIADVFLTDGTCINDRLVELGYATYATYNQIEADRES